MGHETYWLDVRVADEAHALGMLGPIMLYHWRTSFPPGCVQEVRELFDELVEDYPGRLGGVHIVEPGCQLPDAQSRSEASALIKHTASGTAGIGLLMLGQGFAMSAVQSVAFNIFSLGSRVPTKTFRTPPDLGRWLCNLVPESPHAGSLAEAIETFRGTMIR